MFHKFLDRQNDYVYSKDINSGEHMKNKIATLAVGLLLVAGFSLGGPAKPASAWGGNCPSGQFCAWQWWDGAGTIWKYPYSVWGPIGTCHNLTGGNNQWSGIWNRYGSGLDVDAYDGDFCVQFPGEAAQTLYNGYHLNFEGDWEFMDNKVSSFVIRNY
jgi:hypothetical protein